MDDRCHQAWSNRLNPVRYAGDVRVHMRESSLAAGRNYRREVTGTVWTNAGAQNVRQETG